MLKNLSLLILASLLLFSLSQANADVKPVEIVYPDANANSYFVQLLELALSYTDNKYALKKLGEPLPHDRPFIFLQQNKFIDVAWGGARIEREKHNLPIRFPIFKGLNGWRVPIVNSDNKALLAQVTHKEGLKKFSVGLHARWSDFKIFKHNHYHLIPGSSLQGVLNMVSMKHVDYLPQSVLAVQYNLDQHPQFSLVIEPEILIQYPSAYYFYVHKDNHALAKDIQLGLEAALKEGKFDKLFHSIYAPTLKALNLKSRKVIKLTNPLLSDKTPLEKTELWAKETDF
ncbi:substrate-binding periplasmic protein [Algibacillus agarilyticus]|uniref:substrate-binding periplasmic protein n=1 Tax=Algibacillus agarilyticus TaxID=2234133 RepID=UPI000DD03AA8|nr:transporter substrate-binding domain-containing protein [Algibacillus agarilyticus]